MSGTATIAKPGEPAMTAAIFDQCGDSSVFSLRHDVAKPDVAPDSDEVLVRICAASVNPIDYKLRRGDMRPLMPRHFPVIVGRDVSGVVEKVGSKTTRFAVGDEVFGMVDANHGTYAAYVADSERCFVKKPAEWSHAEAAAVPLAALTAWQAIGVYLDDNPVGRKVMVLGGSGGVGTLAVRLFSAIGAKVYATSGTSNVDYVRSLGAERVFDYTCEDFAKVLDDEKLDYVLDTVGKQEDRDKAYNLVTKGGVEATTMPLDPSKGHGAWAIVSAAAEFVAKKMRGMVNGVSYEPMLTEDYHWEQLEKIKHILLEAKFKCHLDATFPLEKIADAHNLIEKGHTRGKIAIEVTTDQTPNVHV